ncbi:MAG: biotin--[acetyl-CoA-carboxylase] ligase [Treponema sp. GWB1_62_6]|nr:MAG: biotin--[acetyl-CoA-carboxylase] ligase [Treponema sp. GWA1_62_8]OHE63390.1 MAG: biotin--[acetyl-CoA-carboxylase] ligase [Treponema sp. GWB1_62_6]OHE65050.1 MAG: biotin--[acetyl-CoA-carboxylase] ligase [Treponema sp. GWC1_61_84]OHE72462.1 MAG: biotin--[acetyl-CoA-carboxylase] ligase [Treponema sp. RIFOXYC1_FULL_61_9]
MSGETLAGDIGLSRVAVWKAAESLRTAGYPIDADEQGYRLDPAAGDDFLFPWEFGPREGRFRHWTETSSTMDRARELAEQRGSGPGIVVVAERQSAGRGRAGRHWESADGGLFFSLLLPGGMPIQRYALTGMAVQLAVASALSALLGSRVSVRWPNDVYVGGRKIAGVLTELRGEADRVAWIAAGVGVNVNNAVPADHAVSCRELAGRPLSRRSVLLSILDELEGREHADLAAAWNAAADGIGERVELIDAGHGDWEKRGSNGEVRTSGIFLGIDCYGRSLVRTGNGIMKVEAGTASLVHICRQKDTPQGVA